MVQAVCSPTLAPLADGLGGDAIALGEDAGALVGAGDLSTGDGGGAGVRMDPQHRSDRPLSGLDQTFKQVAIRGNSMPHRVPTMLRDLTNSGAHISAWDYSPSGRLSFYSDICVRGRRDLHKSWNDRHNVRLEDR